MIAMEINRKEWRLKRLAKDITLKEIADAIGEISYNHLSQFERNPNHRIAEKHIKAYMKYIEEKKV